MRKDSDLRKNPRLITRGLLGFWVFCSSVWVGWLAYRILSQAEEAPEFSDNVRVVANSFVLWGLGPPLGILCVGSVVAWILRSFIHYKRRGK